MNFITVLGAPETVCKVIDDIVDSGGVVSSVKKTQFNATYLIGYVEGIVNGCFLLLEDGSKLLLESGGHITLEICINYLIMEDGSFLLLEDGSKILTEEQE